MPYIPVVVGHRERVKQSPKNMKRLMNAFNIHYGLVMSGAPEDKVLKQYQDVTQALELVKSDINWYKDFIHLIRVINERKI